MHVSKLPKEFLPNLFDTIHGRDILFRDFIKLSAEEQKGKVLLRHDVDDNLTRSVRMAQLQHKHGVKATYFILDTAHYWDPKKKEMWDGIHRIAELGHEIAWHNNALARWVVTQKPIADIINEPLAHFVNNEIEITGSASHGDYLCRIHGFVNYEVFEECGISKKDSSFAQPTHVFPRVKMADFGLKYEAYHLPKQQYFSESGGNWGTLPNEKDFENKDLITQILIHPQWWAEL